MKKEEPAPRRAYSSPLREKQAQETRNSILDALTTLLEDRRADEVTTRELAGAAGVSERTVYRHFPDRFALVDGLSDRLSAARTRDPEEVERLEDLKPTVIDLMADLEAHHAEARAEAILNADPRRYSAQTREHTREFSEVTGVTLPDLDEEQQLAVAAVVRVLVSAQAWLRMREEFEISGDASGPVVAWVIDALIHEVERGNPPPSAG